MITNIPNITIVEYIYIPLNDIAVTRFCSRTKATLSRLLRSHEEQAPEKCLSLSPADGPTLGAKLPGFGRALDVQANGGSLLASNLGADSDMFAAERLSL